MSTRLLKTDREAICFAMLDHKFSPIQAEHDAAEVKLADEVHTRLHGSHLAVMAKLPEKAFPAASGYNVTVGGKRMRVNFGHAFPIPSRPCFNEYHHGDALRLTDDDALGSRILAWASAKEAVRAQRRELEAKTGAALALFHTFDKLIESWPEAETFIAAQWRRRGTYVANLPAATLGDLSAALDLPPEDAGQEQAA